MAGETASWFRLLVRHYGLCFFEGTRSAEIFDLQLEHFDLLEQLPTLRPMSIGCSFLTRGGQLQRFLVGLVH